MKRRIKALALAAVAAFAMSVLMASAASAGELTASKVGAALFGEQPAGSDFTFSVTGGKITCKVGTLAGTTSATSFTTLTLTPNINECEAFGLASQFTLNGCDFLFHTSSAGNTFDIVCPTGKDITVDATASGTICKVHIPPQTGINGIAFATNGNHVDLTAASTNITETVTKESFLCSLSSGEHSNATFSANITLKADGGATAIGYDK